MKNLLAGLALSVMASTLPFAQSAQAVEQTRKIATSKQDSIGTLHLLLLA